MDTSTPFPISRQELNALLQAAISPAPFQPAMFTPFPDRELAKMLLFITSTNNKKDIIETLLERSGREAKALLTHKQPPSNDTALMIAAHSGHAEIIELFVKYLKDQVVIALAETNAFNFNALQLAVQNGHVHAALVLIEAGANIESACGCGTTPLMTSALRGNLAMFETLMIQGANVHAKKTNNDTVLDTAFAFANLMNALKDLPPHDQLPETEMMANRYQVAYRILSSMSVQNLHSLQISNPAERQLKSGCVREVNEIRENMFHAFWDFKKRGVPTDATYIALEYGSYPSWYRHRLKADLNEISTRVDNKFKQKEESTTEEPRAKQGPSKKAKF